MKASPESRALPVLGNPKFMFLKGNAIAQTQAR